jgi:hypothetical protein
MELKMHDLLTVSAANHRLSTELFDYRYVTAEAFNDKTLSIFQDIESRDISLANDIRQYYQNKLLVVTLRGNELSPFRKDLSKLLNNKNMIVTDSFIKLALSMPEFYFYDKEMDELKMALFKQTERAEKGYIKLLKKLNTKKKKEYWFIDDENMLVKFKTDRTNNLSSLWEAYLKVNNDNLKKTDTGVRTINRVIDGLEYKEIIAIF